MITAIIGKAGTGKSTLSSSLKNSYDLYIECDAAVKDSYEQPDVISFFTNHTKLNKAVEEGRINKNILVKLLINDRILKAELEDYLFDSVFQPLLTKAKNEGLSLLVDGVQGRFEHHFEQIIHVSCKDDLRLKNLIERGVSQERAQELFELQSDN